MKTTKTKIMVVLGTRPEIIKLAPVLHELKKNRNRFQTVLVWSGQHIELAKPFLKLFGLTPHYRFDVMQHDQASTDICSNTMKKLSPLFKKVKPDWILVQGDTTTALTATLCAFYHQIPLAHLEAGLRSGNPDQPFPEEKNRELISHLAKLNFAPTGRARENLLREGIDPKSIHVVGNSVVDALQWLLKNYPPPAKLPGLTANSKMEKLLVVTAHRRESFGRPLKNICDAIIALVDRHPDLKVVFPVHLNPRVQNVVFKKMNGRKRIVLTPPIDYISFIHLLTHSCAILSDSGGIQEEAPSLGKPVLVLRDVTERPEAIDTGTNHLVGRETKKIVRAVEKLLYTPKHNQRPRISFPFGRGDTAIKVTQILKDLCR